MRQFLFGAPFDSLDWIFHRAWTTEPALVVEEPVRLDEAAATAKRRAEATGRSGT